VGRDVGGVQLRCDAEMLDGLFDVATFLNDFVAKSIAA
jgi:hypothetical protein